MDNDEAGLEGNYKTIQNLWKHSVLRRTNIAVYVTAGEKKDPDECYKGLGAEETPDVKSYSVPEYLFRYFLRSEGRSLTELDVKTAFGSSCKRIGWRGRERGRGVCLWQAAKLCAWDRRRSGVFWG